MPFTVGIAYSTSLLARAGLAAPCIADPPTSAAYPGAFMQR